MEIIHYGGTAFLLFDITAKKRLLTVETAGVRKLQTEPIISKEGTVSFKNDRQKTSSIH